MSAQTSAARWARDEADQAVKNHNWGCLECEPRRHVRCAEGARLVQAYREADADLVEQRKLDMQPPPGSVPLF